MTGSSLSQDYIFKSSSGWRPQWVVRQGDYVICRLWVILFGVAQLSSSFVAAVASNSPLSGACLPSAADGLAAIFSCGPHALLVNRPKTLHVTFLLLLLLFALAVTTCYTFCKAGTSHPAVQAASRDRSRVWKSRSRPGARGQESLPTGPG